MAKKLQRELSPSELFEARLSDMERKFDRLRALYETFFLGIAKVPPNVPRRELNRLIIEAQQENVHNAGLRFRFTALIQRWVLFTSYWNRTLQEIEMGTYGRDLAKAQRHMAQRGGAITEQEALAIGIPAKRVKMFVERQRYMAARISKKNAVKAPAEAPEQPIPGIGVGDIEGVYERYMATHKTVADGRDPLTLDKIKERLRMQIPKILSEKNCKKVRLDIAVEDGKVKLKAWPVD